jgi:quercetin dioxygenase-like cupin family protein
MSGDSGRRALLASALAALLAEIRPAAAQSGAGQSGQSAQRIFAAALPNVPGKALTAVVVDYAPGGTSPPHRHADSGFIFAYVVAGAVRSKVNDEPERVYRAGEFWTEPPAARHGVSANASVTEPAKLLAVFVADEGATLTTYER